MTNITIYCSNNDYVGFRVSGHSGYSEAGYDIVCAGIFCFNH
ncbi:MAG: ribosomal-processing cysteine protease Prp [Eubacterium sp.]